jgi:heterodisulfide reductase subunit B
MKYGYFPGCSLRGTGRAYEASLLPVFQHLGIQLDELEDWNCCGATAYMSIDETSACVLASRNLALAEKAGHAQLLAPCSACYLVLNKAKHYFHEYPSMAVQVKRALLRGGLSYSGNTPVRHPLDVLIHDVGLEAIRQKVVRPLKSLRVASYYGCQIVRPYATFDDQYNPTAMDPAWRRWAPPSCVFRSRPSAAAAASPAPCPRPASAWSTSCSTRPQSAAPTDRDRLPALPVQPRRLPRQVKSEYGPVCVPTVYFSQLMGLAFGLSDRALGLRRAAVPFHLAPGRARGNPPAEPDPVPAAAAPPNPPAGLRSGLQDPSSPKEFPHGQSAVAKIRIGFYVCHCGHNIASMVDCPEVARYVGTLPGRGPVTGLQVHVLRPGAGARSSRTSGTQAQPRRRRLLLAAPARAHLPQGGRGRRPQPVLLPHGQHPRAQLVGAHRPQEATAKAKALAQRRHQPRSVTTRRPEVKQVPIHPDVLVVGGGIAGIHAALTLANAGKQGDPRRTRADHRRPHGEVRQDLPHARLRRLHPHAQDVRGRQP